MRTEWGAFYEGALEPLAVQFSLEFTRKIFTDREQAFGNSIVFDSGRLIYSSNKTKLDLIKELMPYGVISVNQALEILNLPPVEDGNLKAEAIDIVATMNSYTEYSPSKTGLHILCYALCQGKITANTKTTAL